MSLRLQSNSDLMLDVFSRYEQEFGKSLSSTTRKIQSIDTQPNNKKQLAFSDMKLELTEAERNLKFMQIEVGSFVPQLKTQYQIKIRKYRKQYDQVRRKLNRIQQVYVDEKNKQQLMVGRIDEEGQNGRQRFIKQGQLMSDATYKLKDGLKTIRQTQDIQNGIQMQLVGQTQKMGRMIQKPKVINEDLHQSQYLIKKIGRNIKKNKLILGIVAGIVLLIIVIIIWVVVAKRK